MEKRGLTLVELMVVVGILAILASLLLPALARSRESVRRASCVSNLQQMGMCLRMYSDEQRSGKYPPIANYFQPEVECNDDSYPTVEVGSNAIFFWKPDGMYPEYLTDLSVIVCPSDSGWGVDDLINPATGKVDAFQRCVGPRGWNSLNGSYAYPGYVLDKLDNVPELIFSIDDFRLISGLECVSAPPNAKIGGQLSAYLLAIVDLNPNEREPALEEDLDLSPYTSLITAPVGNGSGNTLKRLRQGIERFLVTDINDPTSTSASASTVPLMWDQISTLPSRLGFNHPPGGTNILYMDGHVEFSRYPGDGPASSPSAVFSGCLEG